jgi:phosphoribosylformylglycinamidine synthase subunit PurS
MNSSIGWPAPHRADRPKNYLYLCFVNLRIPGSDPVGPLRGRSRAGLSARDPHDRRGIPLQRDADRVRVEIRVELKPGVVDAEAESVQRSLGLLGVRSVGRVTTAHVYDLEFDGVSPAEARRLAEEAVDRLLANPVIHRVSIGSPPE